MPTFEYETSPTGEVSNIHMKLNSLSLRRESVILYHLNPYELAKYKNWVSYLVIPVSQSRQFMHLHFQNGTKKNVYVYSFTLEIRTIFCHFSLSLLSTTKYLIVFLDISTLQRRFIRLIVSSSIFYETNYFSFS